MKKPKLRLVPKLPGNSEDWRKVEVIETFIAAARGGTGWALELLVDACDKVISPSDATTQVYKAYLAIDTCGRASHEMPDRVRRQAMMMLAMLEEIDRRFWKHDSTIDGYMHDVKAIDGAIALLRRYKPNKTGLHGVDGILAKMIKATGALDLDHDKHGEPREEDEIRNHVSSLLLRRVPTELRARHPVV